MVQMMDLLNRIQCYNEEIALDPTKGDRFYVAYDGYTDCKTFGIRLLDRKLSREKWVGFPTALINRDPNEEDYEWYHDLDLYRVVNRIAKLMDTFVYDMHRVDRIREENAAND